MNDYEEMFREIDERIRELESRKFKTDEVDKNALDVLNGLIGLANIKKEINKLVFYLGFINKVKGKANIDNLNLHMVFSGNPGTGKTTVARLLADILYSMGYIKTNKVAEITAQDCIAGYIGQSAIKTRELINEYQGGLIFIDEAYAFNNDDENGFAKDAIVEIMKEMEKKETVFIFAGYKNQMDNFININPGLKSRIGYQIDFDDYTNDELMQMFIKKINDSNLRLAEDAKLQFQKLLNSYKENSGNGRLVDNLYNKILLEHAIRTEKIVDNEILLTINREDIEPIMKSDEDASFV